jgi:Major royal jelly protein
MPAPSAVNGPFETMLELNLTPGNVAVTPSGRLFISMHPFGEPEIRVAEVLRNGGLRAYPTDDWSHAVNASGIGIQSIIGLRSDAKGVLWLLDAGNLNQPNGTPPKLIAWDTNGERLQRVVHIPPPISGPKSFLQDLAIDSKRETIYIADCGIGAGFDGATPALIVVYLKTGMARRVLESASCVRADDDAAMVIDGVEVGVSGEGADRRAARVGVNPITIDNQFEWVYFGAMHGRTIWKVKADDLANPGLPAAELEARVLRHGDKAVSDGITIDSAGNIYVTDVGNNAIGVVDPSGTYRVLHRDDALVQWSDGMAAGPDGKIYVTVNQLHRHAALNGGRRETTPPFRVLRFEPLAPAVVGR